MLKNTATKWIVFAFNRTTNAAKTGDAAQITASVYIDGGAANAVDDTNPAELGHGYYIFDITATECNGDLVVIDPVSSTADIQVIGVPGAVWTDTVTADVAAVHVHVGTIETGVADVPTVAEFEARTIPAADYVVVGDTLAGVTLVATCTTNTDMVAAAPTAAAVADAVWDEVLIAADHNVTNSAGKRLRLKSAAVSGTINDAAASTTVFITTVTGKANDFYADQTISFTSGTLDGQVGLIAHYDGATGTITLEEPLTSAPANGVAFDILAIHAHTMSHLAAAVWENATAVQLAADATDILVDTGTTLDAKIDSILTDTEATLDAAIAAVKADTAAILLDTAVIGVTGAGLTSLATQDSVDDIKAETALIVADTAELQTDWVDGGRLDLLLDGASAPTAAAVADAVWNEAMADHVAAGSFGEGVANAASAGDPWSTPIPGAYAPGTAGKKISDMTSEVTAILVDTGTTLDTKINTIDGIVDTILLDTAELQTDWVNGGRLDLIIDHIGVDTNSIIADVLDLHGDVGLISAPVAASAIADAVWDEVISTGHAVGNSAAVKLMAAATGLATSTAGLGAVACVVTVTVSAVPLQNCDVWVTSDEAGVTVVAGTLQTNASGQVTFYLDAGTYYVWQQKTGYNFTNPDELIVT